MDPKVVGTIKTFFVTSFTNRGSETVNDINIFGFSHQVM